MLAAFATRSADRDAVIAELADATAASAPLVVDPAAAMAWSAWPCDAVVCTRTTNAATNGAILVVVSGGGGDDAAASSMVEAIARMPKLDDAAVDAMCGDAQIRLGAVSLLVADARCPEDHRSDRIRWFVSCDALGVLPVYHGWVAKGAQIHVSTSRIAVAHHDSAAATPLQAGHVLTSAHGGESPRPWRPQSSAVAFSPSPRSILLQEAELDGIVIVDGNTPRLGAALASMLPKGTTLLNVTYKASGLDLAEAVRLVPEVVRCIETTDPVYVSACLPIYYLFRDARRRGHRGAIMPTTAAFKDDGGSVCFTCKQTYYHAVIKMARRQGVRVHFPMMALRFVEAVARTSLALDDLVAAVRDEAALRLPAPAPREDYTALHRDLERHYASSSSSMKDGIREHAAKVASQTTAAIRLF